MSFNCSDLTMLLLIAITKSPCMLFTAAVTPPGAILCLVLCTVQGCFYRKPNGKGYLIFM